MDIGTAIIVAVVIFVFGPIAAVLIAFGGIAILAWLIDAVAEAERRNALHKRLMRDAGL